MKLEPMRAYDPYQPRALRPTKAEIEDRERQKVKRFVARLEKQAKSGRRKRPDEVQSPVTE